MILKITKKSFKIFNFRQNILVYAGAPKFPQELFFWSYYLRVCSSYWRKHLVVMEHWSVQLYSSDWEWRCSEDWEENGYWPNQWVNELIIHKGVYRKVPATPGLLNTDSENHNISTLKGFFYTNLQINKGCTTSNYQN